MLRVPVEEWKVVEEEWDHGQVEQGQTGSHQEVSWVSTSPLFGEMVWGSCVGDTQCPEVPNDLDEVVDEVDVKGHDRGATF